MPDVQLELSDLQQFDYLKLPLVQSYYVPVQWPLCDYVPLSTSLEQSNWLYLPWDLKSKFS